MRTAAYKVDVASDRRRRENVPRHILCSEKLAKRVSYISRYPVRKQQGNCFVNNSQNFSLCAH